MYFHKHKKTDQIVYEDRCTDYTVFYYEITTHEDGFSLRGKKSMSRYSFFNLYKPFYF